MALPFEPTKNPEQYAALKGQEHDRIQTLIERDEKQGTLNPTQAAEYRTQNDRGRLLLYGVGGEFDDYLSRDELNATLTSNQNEETRATTITLFNPAWGDGKAEVALADLPKAFDRKEAVALVDTLRGEQSLEIQGLEWDPEHRKVFAAVKNAEGNFRVEMDLDLHDGSHGAPKYRVTDKNGTVAEIEQSDLNHLGQLPYKTLPPSDKATAEKKAAPAVPENRASDLNQKFTAMAKFKKEFFREGGMPERPLGATRQATEKVEKPALSPSIPKEGPLPQTPASGGSLGEMPKTTPPARAKRAPSPPVQTPVQKPVPQRPNRFTGIAAPAKHKGPSLWPALAAGGATGGALIGIPSATGLFTLLFSKHQETTAFLNTLVSFFA